MADAISSSERIARLCAQLRAHNRDYRVEPRDDHLVLLYNSEGKMYGEPTIRAFLENELAKFVGGGARRIEADYRAPLADGVEHGGGGIYYSAPAGASKHF